MGNRVPHKPADVIIIHGSISGNLLIKGILIMNIFIDKHIHIDSISLEV